MTTAPRTETNPENKSQNPSTEIRNTLTPNKLKLSKSKTPNSVRPIHRDPFDRMLVAQASAEELRVVSHDRVFERYGLSAEGLPPIIV
jgi:PIN domain nuclease of toxin-antitoxin system